MMAIQPRSDHPGLTASDYNGKSPHLLLCYETVAMQKPALILFLAAGLGGMSRCGSLENLTYPAKVWDDGQSRLVPKLAYKMGRAGQCFFNEM
jgi:hypothetical protein